MSKRNANPTTVVELCKAKGLNPKVVRAKLRRAVKQGKLEHTHKSNWTLSPRVLTVLGLGPKKAKASKKSTPVTPTETPQEIKVA